MCLQRLYDSDGESSLFLRVTALVCVRDRRSIRFVLHLVSAACCRVAYWNANHLAEGRRRDSCNQERDHSNNHETLVHIAILPLMDRDFAACRRFVFAEQEGKRNHDERRAAENEIHILISQRV